MMQILEELDNYMEKNNLTQKEIAKTLNVDTATISRWRAGAKIGVKNLRGLRLLIKKETVEIDESDHFSITTFEKWNQLSEKSKEKVFKYMVELLHSQ